MAGEQGWIKNTQLTVAGRYKNVVLPLTSNATGAAYAIAFPQDCYIRSITFAEGVIAAGGPTAVNVGTAGTPAAYGTVAISATQAANSVVNGTVTGLLVPRNTVINITSAASGTGTSQITLEVEMLETT